MILRRVLLPIFFGILTLGLRRARGACRENSTISGPNGTIWSHLEGAFSHPVCLNANEKPFLRFCNETLPDKCDRIQTNSACPPHFYQDGDWCVLVTMPKRFSSNCNLPGDTSYVPSSLGRAEFFWAKTQNGLGTPEKKCWVEKYQGVDNYEKKRVPCDEEYPNVCSFRVTKKGALCPEGCQFFWAETPRCLCKMPNCSSTLETSSLYEELLVKRVMASKTCTGENCGVCRLLVAEARQKMQPKPKHERIIDFFTMAGCTVSFVGIIVTFFLSLKSKTGRASLNLKVIFSLLATILLEVVIVFLFTLKNFDIQLSEEACSLVEILLQYVLFSKFSWIFLYLGKYIKGFLGDSAQNDHKNYFKSTLIAWGMPVLPVGGIYLLNNSSKSNQGLCYPKDGNLYLGILLPGFIIIWENLRLIFEFVWAWYNPSPEPVEDTPRPVQESGSRLKTKLLRSLFLLTLLVLPWVLELITKTLSPDSLWKEISDYVFAASISLQGLILFVFFVMVDKNVQGAFKYYMESKFRTRSSPIARRDLDEKDRNGEVELQKLTGDDASSGGGDAVRHS